MPGSHTFSGTAVKSIFAPVPGFCWNAGEQASFQTYLERRSAGTEIVPAVDCEQLRMAVNGQLVENGYRFTMLGFNAVCGAISPGLASVFYELSGENPRKLSQADAFSVPAAVGIYNAAMQARFPMLTERGLLLSHTEKTVDGFLGAEHRFLDNNLFFSMLYEETTSQRAAAAFERAEIVGRAVSVYMVDTDTPRTDVLPDSRHMFATGWAFLNREDTGAALVAAPCVYTRFGPAIVRSRGMKLSHVGADITGRAASLIARAVGQSVDFDRVKTRIRALAAKRLGFSARQSEQDVTINKIVSFLAGYGVRRDAAKIIAQNAAAVGADIEPRDYSAAYDPQVLRSRNFYDLVCAILRYAKQQPGHSRLLLQATVMNIILPSTKKFS